MASNQQQHEEVYGHFEEVTHPGDLPTQSSTTAGTSRDIASEPGDDDRQPMSSAAARRSVRRSLRQTDATPDLVTSLVRSPSPDTLYAAPETQGQTVLGTMSETTWNAPYLTAGRLANTGTGRRSGPLLPPHPSSLDIPKRYGGNSVFDLYSLTYVNDPDPNLFCPICHDPLVDPVTTPCDHTFCYRCMRRSISSSPSGTACPIDREQLAWKDCFSAARLIRTQLNSLIVKCPYHRRGCIKEMRREMVERHATTECRFREYPCPGADCDKKVRYKPTTDETCHHREDSCTYCHAAIEDADREIHLLSCPRTKTRCEDCWQLIRREQMAAHHEVECDGVEVPCPYKDVGCPVQVVRKHLNGHSLTCAFHPDTPSGAIIRTQRELIRSYGDLGSQLRDVHARQDENSRRLGEISAAINRRGGGGSALGDNRTIQDLDAGFEEVHQNLTHLEARQSMWTLNQVMPIREEVAELRNNINMIRMHVNWLLNRSREEGRIRATNNTGTSTTLHPDGGSEAVRVLPERRRSSGTDIDLPRL